jgi:acyl-CoA synthetase (AMP-forming)/AMP-acid ligase II
LKVLAYGGGKMPLTVIERALTELPNVGFVNAYGLTETSSTISVLGPEDHRAAFESNDETVRRRLGSVGRPHAGVEVQVRDALGEAVAPMEPGEIWVRGPQVSGQYLARDSRVHDGWFPTNDGGMIDDDGYLFVTGRLDDVIVRGGENLSPGEIEEVLLSHRYVEDVAVVGVPSSEWGETIAAFVVVSPAVDVSVDELKSYVRERLRSNRVPEFVYFRGELPYSETGKLLRRELRRFSEVG